MITRASRRLLSGLCASLCVAQLTICFVPPATVTKAVVVARRRGLLKHDRTRLVEALAQNKPAVTVLIAARRGMNERLGAEVRRLNATVQYRDDEVDYLRAEIPTRSVQELSLFSAIESINLAGSIDYLNAGDDELQSPATVNTNRVPAPDRDTPAVNPYLPASAIGAPQFIADHPTFDGRGVVVAVIDTNIDPLLPELRTAKALDGTTVPKFADIYCAAPNALVEGAGDSHISGYMRVAMDQRVKAENGKLGYQGHTYSVANDDEYRIGVLNERIAGPTGDLNRDGNPPGSNELFAVLWNEATNTVWVDTNQNSDFTDEQPMTDYRVKQDIRTFGRDDPATPVRDTVAFVVQTDLRHHDVFVIPGYGAHGTGVTGAAFGAGFFGGKMNGVAPGAQIISIPAGRGPRVTGSFIEAMITAMKDPRVDLVTLEFGNYLPLNDGHSTFSTIANRLIEKYDKLIFAAAGNGNDGLNGVVSPADAEKVIAVGSYLSRETIRVNYGVELSDPDNLSGYTSHGPTKEGGLKPDLLAPSASLSTKLGFLPGENRYGTYSLPTGYQIYNGTSTSSPFAAAGAALLISAAKQSRLKYDAKRLRAAILSSARFLPKYSPELQGAGLLQISAAWDALKNSHEPVEIISRAPVKAVLSDYLREPDQGTGIFEREGWTAGQSGRRIISFTRTSGNPGLMKFQLSWTRNDGTFAAPAEISLPLNRQVDVVISISPQTNGVHSAVLNLVANGAVFHRVMNTIVAAEQLNARNSFTMTRSGEAEWLHSQSYFVYVPAGTPALQVDVRIREGNAMPSLTRPNGRFYYSLSPDQSPVRFTRHQGAGSWSRVIDNPDPGVWQITLDNTGFEASVPHGSASFQVTAALLGVSLASRRSSVFQPHSQITYANTHADFVGGIATTALASTYSVNATVNKGEPVQYVIDVPEGATRVGATLTSTENDAGDLDLYLFDCTGSQCVLRDFSTNNGSMEQVAVDAPGAGTWKVVIDPFRQSSRTGTPPYQYKDYFLHPSLGRVEVTSGPKEIARGITTTQRVALKLNGSPTNQRQREAMIYVTSEPTIDRSVQASSDRSDLYYSDKGILGTMTIPLRRPAGAARKQASHGARP